MRPSRDIGTCDHCARESCGSKEEEFSVSMRTDGEIKACCLSENRRVWIERMGIGRKEKFLSCLVTGNTFFQPKPKLSVDAYQILRKRQTAATRAVQQPNFFQPANALLNYSRVGWSKFSLYGPKSQISQRVLQSEQYTTSTTLDLDKSGANTWAETAGGATQTENLLPGWTDTLM